MAFVPYIGSSVYLNSRRDYWTKTVTLLSLCWGSKWKLICSDSILVEFPPFPLTKLEHFYLLQCYFFFAMINLGFVSSA